jgi:hypothetical protein
MPPTIYPISNPIHADIGTVLNAIAANKAACTSCYLDTLESQGDAWSNNGENHHQGLARTHKLKDGSVYFFLSHSHLGGQGELMQFRYHGPTDQDHIGETDPLTIAKLAQLLKITEEHPSDIVFLPDVNGLDAGYLFVTEEFTQHKLAIYSWKPHADFKWLGDIVHNFPNAGTRSGPNFVFIDNVAGTYFLGIANNHAQECKLFAAAAADLFPVNTEGGMNVDAFKPVDREAIFPFPIVGQPCQAKLIRNTADDWHLLAFRSDPDDDPHGTDYVDVYPIKFNPFKMGNRLSTIHISFKPGDTGFANTGTHHVEVSGRLLISSSYRWAEDQGPGSSGYVSRVDEIPSLLR